MLEFISKSTILYHWSKCPSLWQHYILGYWSFLFLYNKLPQTALYNKTNLLPHSSTGQQFKQVSLGSLLNFTRLKSSCQLGYALMGNIWWRTCFQAQVVDRMQFLVVGRLKSLFSAIGQRQFSASNPFNLQSQQWYAEYHSYVSNSLARKPSFFSCN